MSDTPEGFRPAGFSPGFLDAGGPYWLRPAKGGGSVVGLRIGDGHLNYHDVAHGGVVSTFADVALSWQIHDAERPRPGVVTLSLTVNFAAAARLGDWLEASARIDRLGGRTAFASGRILRGEDVVATMSGAFKVARGG